jgi:hypothetical protein
VSSPRDESDKLFRAAQALVAFEDHVDLRIEFDWKFVGSASLDPVADRIVVPNGLGGAGVYRLRSGRRESGADFDCWYVGRTMRDVKGRVTFHASDPSLRVGVGFGGR